MRHSGGYVGVLIRCRPEGICYDAAFRIMVRKSFLLFVSLLEAVFYDIGPRLPSLSCSWYDGVYG